jgi:hypothetical protein
LSCGTDQLAKWNGAAWACGNDAGGTSYGAGMGLLLSGSVFSVDTAVIQRRIIGACGAGQAIRQVTADGSVVCEADDNTTYTAGVGLALSDTQFRVSFAGSGGSNNVARADHHHLGQTWTGSENPLKIEGSFSEPDYAPLLLSNNHAEGDGLRITSAGEDGVYVGSVGRTGVLVGSTGAYGVLVRSAGSSGVYVHETGSDGVYVREAGSDGVVVREAGSDGVVVGAAGSDGVVVGAAGSDGVYVREASGNGVWARTVSVYRYGGYFENSADGGVGLRAEGGGSGAIDIVLGGPNGILSADLDYAGSDMVLISNDDAVVRLDRNGDEHGLFRVRNDANSDVFTVDEDGDMTASGTKSAVVDAGQHGWVKLYAMESAENWFEDFGTARVEEGEATVTIEPVFAATVNLGEAYHVFVTPLGDCGLYVADKTATSFSVRALGGAACSVDFDYRIVAKRLGYENLRLETVDMGQEE